MNPRTRRNRRPDRDSYEALRERMVAETSAWVSECLRHPELAARIPVIVAGSGRFPPTLADTFWRSILDD